MPTIHTFAAYLFNAWHLLAERLGRPGAGGLDELDDRTLADLGVHRSEILSVEAEWLGRSKVTRLRIAAGAGHA